MVEVRGLKLEMRRSTKTALPLFTLHTTHYTLHTTHYTLLTAHYTTHYLHTDGFSTGGEGFATGGDVVEVAQLHWGGLRV